MKKIARVLILLLIFSITNVDAAATTNATVYADPASSTATTIQYRGYSESNRTLKSIKKYKSTLYKVEFNGTRYDAICIDPGIKSPVGPVTCSPAPDDGALAELGSMINSYDRVTFQLAARFVSIYNGYTYYQDFSDLKYALVSYLQIKGGDAAHEEKLRQAMIREGLCTADNCGTDVVLNNMIWGDTAVIQNAFDLASQIRGHMGAADAAVAASGFDYVASGDSRNVTIQVSSKNGVEIQNVRFECSRGCTVSGQSWSGTSGTVNITLTENSCAYEIKTIYSGSGPYLCTKNQHSQTLLMYVEDGELEDIYQGESGVCSDCCTEAPKIEPGHIEGTVNNCCDAAHSEAKEYELDELFCYDEGVKVEYFKKKCNIDYYREEIINNYCELFCTERVTVDTPGSITAVSGRYFELTKTSFGHTYPHIEGFKRCRVRIEWDKWISEYEQQVRNQITNYNNVQYERAREKVYNTAVSKTQSDPISVSVNCSCTYYKSCPTATNPNKKCPETDSATGDDSGTVTYTIYEFSLLEQIYQKIKLNENRHNPGNEKYEAIEILHDSLPEYSHTKYSISQSELSRAKSDRDKIVDNAETECENNLTKCNGTASATKPSLTAEGSNFTVETVPDVKSQIQSNITSGTGAYNAAAEQAKIMEEDLTTCNIYFDTVSPEEIFPFNANADFSYSQTYLDDYGELRRDEIFIEKADSGGCTITRNDGGDEIKPPRYSDNLYSKISHDIEKVQDLATKGTINLETTSSGHVGYRDAMYDASKIFTHDARFQAICDWDDGDNTIYTLVPNGAASESTSEINYTQHDRQYRVYLSTLDGTYETFWHVSGLGTNAKFDQFFLDNGTTCAGESANDVSMFTCKLHVEYEIVLTGYCNGVTNGTDNCDPYKEGYDLFNFKVVDPSDLFPAVSDPEDVNYGYNWLIEERGREVLGTIQETGRKDETYAIDNLTYAFELSPTDMQHIKAYNETRLSEGGYSDFELTCKETCNISVDVDSSVGCRKCHSKFLENLASGKVIYNGTDHEVIGWANTQETLGEVRNGNNW